LVWEDTIDDAGVENYEYVGDVVIVKCTMPQYARIIQNVKLDQKELGKLYFYTDNAIAVQSAQIIYQRSTKRLTLIASTDANASLPVVEDLEFPNRSIDSFDIAFPRLWTGETTICEAGEPTIDRDRSTGTVRATYNNIQEENLLGNYKIHVLPRSSGPMGYVWTEAIECSPTYADAPPEPTDPSNLEDHQPQQSDINSDENSQAHEVPPPAYLGPPIVLSGHSFTNRHNPENLNLMVILNKPGYEISFVTRVFSVAGGKPVIINETRTDWSQQNAATVKKPPLRPSAGARQTVQYAAEIRHPGSPDPGLTYIFDSK
jgi:hypothetical protein